MVQLAPLGRSRVFLAWIVLAMVLLGAVQLATPPEAQGQEVSCAAAIAEAREQYRDRRFDAAIRRLYECLIRDGLREEDIVAGHRLLALAYLRIEDRENAERTVARLLSRVPEYAPDSVQDPPPYVALVRAVKTRADAATGQQTDATPAPSVPQPARRWALALGVGITHYGGERGRPAGTLWEDLAQEPGIAIQAKAAYRVSPRFEAGFRYATGVFPELLVNKGNLPNAPRISEWIHEVGLFGTARFFRGAPVVPYAQAGISGAFTLDSDEVRAGVGPNVAVGARAPVRGPVGVFAEATGEMIFSGEALDGVDHASAYDTLVWFAAGLRYQF